MLIDKLPKPCVTCRHFRKESYASVDYICHCLLDTGVRRGINKERTECTTWKPRREDKHEVKKPNPEDA